MLGSPYDEGGQARKNETGQNQTLDHTAAGLTHTTHPPTLTRPWIPDGVRGKSPVWWWPLVMGIVVIVTMALVKIQSWVAHARQ